MSIATLEKPKNRRRNGALISPDPPLLLNGDHLTVPEFERRYWATPEIKKAELIEGIVVMSPPISNLPAETHGMLGAYLRRYARETPGVSLGLNGSIRLDGKNEYQPDALLRIQSGPGFPSPLSSPRGEGETLAARRRIHVRRRFP